MIYFPNELLKTSYLWLKLLGKSHGLFKFLNMCCSRSLSPNDHSSSVYNSPNLMQTAIGIFLTSTIKNKRNSTFLFFLTRHWYCTVTPVLSFELYDKNFNFASFTRNSIHFNRKVNIFTYFKDGYVYRLSCNSCVFRRENCNDKRRTSIAVLVSSGNVIPEQVRHHS